MMLFTACSSDKEEETPNNLVGTTWQYLEKEGNKIKLKGVGNGNTIFTISSEGKELYKINVNDPNNHDDVITHLEPVMLECEVKWVL